MTTQIVPHPYAYNAHGPGRRQFSVLCWRGWCDPDYRDREIGAMVGLVTGKSAPRVKLPDRVCQTPTTCECECHDTPALLSERKRRVGMAAQITDPADRLGYGGDGSGEEFVKALEKRYGDQLDILMRVPHFAERYASVCDLVVQLLWPERYGATPADPSQHTSDPAREIARLIFAAAALEPEQ